MRDESDPIWRALADSSRRKLLDELRAGPRTTSDLCREFRTSRFAVMKHLDVLAEAGLVRAERRGRERWNHLQTSPLRPIGRWLDRYAGLPAAQEAGSRGSDWSPGID